MKKISIFALLLLLVGQTILGPIGTVNASELAQHAFSLNEVGVTDENGQPLDEQQIEGGAILQLLYEWAITGELEVGEIFSYSIPNGITVSESSGDLLVEESKIGSYAISDHKLTIIIEEIVEVYGSGTITVTGQVASNAIEGFVFGGTAYTISRPNVEGNGEESEEGLDDAHCNLKSHRSLRLF